MNNKNIIINQVRQELIEIGDEKSQLSTIRFFREATKTYGVKNPLVEKIGKKYYQLIKDKSKNEIFECCTKLWQSGYLEESIIACQWSYHVRKKYIPDDIQIFEKWISAYVNNWASCDTLCNHTVGDFLIMHPEYISTLKLWAKSENRWVRRAAAVSLIVPAKKGLFIQHIIEIADILLMDSDDLVQKGYGWMLKSASQAHQKEIYEYVLDKKAMMPRTALRYAIEKMPTELKDIAMKR